MGVNCLTAEVIRKYIPCRILSLGFPDHLHGSVDLTGSSLTSIDIIKHHGSEVVVDLSYPHGPNSVLHELGLFDLVIDCGTIEHCSNPAQAFLNAASCVKQNGRILHELPISMVNHGYWNICPSWYTDFYNHNKFSIESMELHLNGSFFDVKQIAWPSNDPNSNMVLIQPAVTMCVARRTTFDPITLPLCQSKWIK